MMAFGNWFTFAHLRLLVAGRSLIEGSATGPSSSPGSTPPHDSICHPGLARALGLSPRHPMACLRRGLTRGLPEGAPWVR